MSRLAFTMKLSAAASLLLAVIACAASAGGESSAETSPSAYPSPASTHPLSTSSTSLPERRHVVGLYRVDPATLQPIPGSEPVTSGDWISGSSSNNGDWLVLNVWIDTEPDTDIVRVVDVSTGDVVTHWQGPLLHDLVVGDDGSVYRGTQTCGQGASRMAPGTDRFSAVFDSFPAEFCPVAPMTPLDRDRLGWFGWISENPDEYQAGIVIGDMSDGSVALTLLPSVTVGSVGEQDLGDWVALELIEPAVVWDSERDRAYVIHADQPQVSLVDLTTGDLSEHSLEKQTWVDGLLTWLMPPAQAKGPSFGVKKYAALSPSGDVLYTGGEQSEVVTVEDGTWRVETFPRGIDVISTDTWEVLTRFEIPASQLTLSPDGKHLVTTGVEVVDTLSSSGTNPTGAFIIGTDTMEVVAEVDYPGEWHPDVQFSADSRYAYLTHFWGGKIAIVDLENGRTLDQLTGSERLTVFGEAAMLSTPIRP